MATANGWPRPGGLPVPTWHNSQQAFGNSRMKTPGEGPLFHPPKGAARVHRHPEGQGSSPCLQRGRPDHARAAEPSGKLGKTPAGRSLLSPPSGTLQTNKVYCSCSTCRFGTEGIQGSGNMKGGGGSQAAACRLAEQALQEKRESWGERERASVAVRCPGVPVFQGEGPASRQGAHVPLRFPGGAHVSARSLVDAHVPVRWQWQLHARGPVGSVPPAIIRG